MLGAESLWGDDALDIDEGALEAFGSRPAAAPLASKLPASAASIAGLSGMDASMAEVDGLEIDDLALEHPTLGRVAALLLARSGIDPQSLSRVHLEGLEIDGFGFEQPPGVLLAPGSGLEIDEVALDMGGHSSREATGARQPELATQTWHLNSWPSSDEIAVAAALPHASLPPRQAPRARSRSRSPPKSAVAVAPSAASAEMLRVATREFAVEKEEDEKEAEVEESVLAELFAPSPPPRPRLVGGGLPPALEERALVAASQAWSSQGGRGGQNTPGGGWGLRQRPRDVEMDGGDANAGEDEEALLIARCRQEGPPGPASAVLVAVRCGGADRLCTPLADVPTSLSESVGWLCALRQLNLPLDRFHLGLGGSGGGSPMISHNLAAVRLNLSPPQRWHLVVLVRRVEVVAGELDAIVCDPTGEARATIDRHVIRAWPHAVCAGSALLLDNVVAVPPPAQAWPPQAYRPQLLITERSLGRCFAAGDVSPEEAARLIADAKAALGRSV